MNGQQHTTNQPADLKENRVQANRAAGSSDAAGRNQSTTKRPVSTIIPSIMGGENQALGFGSRSGSATSGTQSAAGRQHKLKQRFTVIKKLGKGTYGKVQLAINKETGQEVAIKTIKKTKIENEQDLERVRREIQIMSSIEHPHIIHIYEVFENRDKIVLIMQYAPGGELYEYVSQSKKLDEHEARRLFRQIATAIFYCHQNKICHRDLKLENILLDEKNNAKLADFGLSNVFDKNHQLKTFCGSPLYASPEIVQGSPYEGPEVDCWSLGVLLYTLVYGAMPFDGSNFKRLVKQISEASYYEPKQRSQASPLIGRLLCADPRQRASIRDICSDPWVNDYPAGSLSASSPRVSPKPLANSNNNNNNGQGAQHPSLLKVAQDMANLTPVRLDILLAITRDSIGTKQQQAQLPPPETGPIEAADCRMEVAGPRDEASELRERQNQQRDLQIKDRFGPDLMQVDENRSTSPVANFVVRDLEPAAPASEPAQVDAVDMRICPEEQSHEPKAPLEVDLQVPSLETDNLNETKASEESSQESQLADSNICQSTSKMDIEPTRTELEVKDPQEVELELRDVDLEPQDRGVESAEKTTDVSTEQESKESASNEMDFGTKDLQAAQGTELDGAEAALQFESEDKTKEADCGREANQSAAAEPIGSDDAPSEQPTGQADGAQAEGKAKRVKKRIIVVKKKKRVVKKDDKEQESAQAGGEQVGEDQQQDSKMAATGSDKVPSGKSPTATTCATAPQPGKVRIPETFQPVDQVAAAAADEQQVQAKATRRQSALIADVSQKLLQLQQQDAAQTTSAIELDQHQLASVRVSDTKSEFERRASLAASAMGPTGSSPKGTERNAQTPVSSQTHGDSAQLVVAAMEPMETIKSIVISAEPVIRQEPIQFQTLKVLDASQLAAASEPQTPTNSQQRNPLIGHETLVKCADRLSAEAARCDNREGDDRSDSVETIKADCTLPELSSSSSSAGRGAKVRSSLHIDLRPTNSSCQADRQRADVSPGGQQVVSATSFEPAPITRSYKKVTFTKDGTCVTETGRIYSTRADDGTLRRVERKSKVTHYPSDSKTPGEASTSHEEIVYESSTAAGGGGGGDDEIDSSENWRQMRSQQHQRASPMLRHHLERLVMPTSAEDVFDDQLDSAALDQDSHFYQRDRTGSGSSCSSGSTDVFDDIFDTWTGAISMFNQGRHLAGLRGSLMKHRAFGPAASPASVHSGQRSGRNSLLRHNSGTLCDRPQSSGPGGGFFSDRHHHHHHHHHQQQQQQQQPFQRNTSAGQQQARCESADVTAHPADLFGFATTRPRPRRHRHSSSQAPSWATPNVGAHGAGGRMSAEPSGYESDVPFERPTSAATLGSARGKFGSSNLFPRPGEMLNQTFGHDDGDLFGADWPGSSLLERMELEHEMMRRQFAQKRQQMWRGSTPSLNETAPTSSHFFQADNQPPHQSPHQQQPQQQVKRSTIVCQTSSGASLRQSIPLDTAPIQRNTANLSQHLPPRQPARSTSKTSIITSQLANIQLSHPNDPAQQRHKSASFIELKRDSSSSSSRTQANQKSVQQHVHLQQQQPFESVASSSSQAPHHLADTQLTPTTCYSNASWTCYGGGGGQTTSDSSSMSQHQPDDSETNSRIQNWLLQSSGNLSVSSGTKSTTSDATLPSSSGRSDMTTGGVGLASSASQMPGRSVSIATPQANIQERNQTVTRTRVSCHQLPPAPSRSACGGGGGGSSSGAKQVVGGTSRSGWPTAQPISMIVRSSSKKSLCELEQPGRLERHKVHETIETIVSDDPTSQSCTIVEHSHQATATAASGHSEPFAYPSPLAMQQQQRQAQVVETRSVSTSSRQMFTQRTVSPAMGQELTQPEMWTQQVGQQQPLINSFHVSSTRPPPPPIEDFSDFDSLIGSAAELDSRSSSSLLDQLRSRGYRSIMNQRNMTPGTVQQQQQFQQHTDSTAAPTELDVVTSSSNSMLTMSSSGLGHGQGSFIEDQQQQQQRPGANERELGETLNEPTEQFEVAPNNSEPEEQFQRTSCSGSIIEIDALEDGASNSRQLAPNGFQLQRPAEVTAHNNLLLKSGQAADLLSQTPIEQEEDLDEDVREAKANVKEYLDRIKETEKFIKSMHEEEERAQRQRQESFLFNNLLMSTKLNAIKTSGSHKLDWTSGATNNPLAQTVPADLCLGESHSAPVMMTSNAGRLLMNRTAAFKQDDARHLSDYSNSTRIGEHQLTEKGASCGRALSLEPTFSCFSASLFSPLTSTGSALISAQRNPIDSPFPCARTGDPLEPVQPIGLDHRLDTHFAQRARWQRSKSQLSDQFHSDLSPGTSFVANGRRPLSASIDRYSNTSNPYFPSRNRHRSSTRYQASISTGAFVNVTTKDNDNDDDEPIVMSEYKSSFREPQYHLRQRHHSLAPTSPSRCRPRPTSPWSLTNPTIGATSGRLSSENESDHLDDDHELSAYRPSRYVPKFASAAATKSSARSVSVTRDDHLSGRLRDKSPSSWTGQTSYQTPSRRRSMQTPVTSNTTNLLLGDLKQANCDSDEASDLPARRRSWTTSEPSKLDAANGSSGGGGGSSRLSELEQRLQANKRRREELLQGINSSEKQSSQRPIVGESAANGHDQDELDGDQLEQSCGFERPSRPVERDGGAQQKSSSTRESSLTNSADVQLPERNKTTLGPSSTRHRASRLESMEARIRRKSYCVRVRSPKRSVA